MLSSYLYDVSLPLLLLDAYIKSAKQKKKKVIKQQENLKLLLPGYF